MTDAPRPAGIPAARLPEGATRPLAAGEVACRWCGAGTPADGAMPASPDDPAPLGCCEACARVRETARLIAAGLPWSTDEATRSGLPAAMLGIDAVGEPLPGQLSVTEAHSLVLSLTEAAERTFWTQRLLLLPEDVRARTCAAERWSALGPGDRIVLVATRRRCPDVRGAANPGSVRVAPPWLDAAPGFVTVGHGCLFCGVGGLEVPGAEVARDGGPSATAREVWEPVTVTDAASLRCETDGEPLRGYLCPLCLSAVHAIGAFGIPAVDVAVERHGRALHDDYLTNLVRWTWGVQSLRVDTSQLTDYLAQEPVTPWCALVVAARRAGAPEVRPGAVPWAHVRRPWDDAQSA